ncbi:hypothetical protein DJ530_00395 [Sulfolobus sp. E1]|nr:hypothetical protein DJ530_00395 [Sulfolobus sp. E1]
MVLNGIKAEINIPGEIPWEIVLAYFVLATVFVIYIAKVKGGLKQFSTLDIVYLAIGASLGTAWEFYIGPFIDRGIPSTPFISIGFWGRILIIIIFVSLVRKVGSGMLSLTIYTLLADLFHYGFGEQPLYFIYEALTYGLYIDLIIAISGGKIFGIGLTPSNNESEDIALRKLRRKQTILVVIEGVILGVLLSIPDPIFYLGFLRPFIYGASVNWAYIIFTLLAFIPGNVIVSIMAGLLSLRVVRALGQ